MARLRRVSIIEGMFKDICTQEELSKVDQLYNEGQKGPAIVYMLRRIRGKWVELLNAPEPVKTDKVYTAPPEDFGFRHLGAVLFEAN